MPDIVTLSNDQLTAFLPGTATQAQELVTRVASLILADQDANLQTGGGLSFALRSGKLSTDASVINQFTMSAARVRIAMGAQADLPLAQQITSIQLASHTLESRRLTLNVRLVLGISTGTLDFTLRVV